MQSNITSKDFLFSFLCRRCGICTLLLVDRLSVCFLFKTLCLLEIDLLHRGSLTWARLLLPALISNTKCRQAKCDITGAGYENEHSKANVTFIALISSNKYCPQVAQLFYSKWKTQSK